MKCRPWSNRELLILFKCFKAERGSSWCDRAAAALGSAEIAGRQRREKGFFTSEMCKEEFDRVMSEPCPADVPTGANYSRSAVVDAWIQYFVVESKKEDAFSEKVMEARIRSCQERIQTLLRNYRKYTITEIDSIWKTIQAENDGDQFLTENGKEDAEAFDLAYSMFYNRLDEVLDVLDESVFSCNIENDQSNVTASPVQLTKGAASVFRSPSASRSPVKVPPAGTSSVSSVIKTDSDSSPSCVSASPSMESPRRPRGRPKKVGNTPIKEISNVSVEVSKQNIVSEEGFLFDNSDSNSSSIQNFDSSRYRDVLSTPASRIRSARRSVAVDSRLSSKTNSSKRASAGDDLKDEPKEAVHTKEGRSLSALDSVAVHVNAMVQTMVSFFNAPLRSSDKTSIASIRRFSRSERRTSTTLSATSFNASNNDVYVQTNKLKLDSLEKLFIFHSLKIPWLCFSAEISRQDHGDRRKMHVGRRVYPSTESNAIVSWDDEGDCYKQKKQHKENISTAYVDGYPKIYMVTFNAPDDECISLGKELDSGQIVEQEDESSKAFSTAKRLRRDEKALSDIAPTPKGRMLSMWNTLHEHRHSAVFLHPVTDKDAPGYNSIVFSPVDLNTLKREAESGVIIHQNSFLLKMFMMFGNAVMFNSTGHDVNIYAKEMCKAVMVECLCLFDPRFDAVRLHNRRSRQEDPNRRCSTNQLSGQRNPIKKKR